MVRPQPPVKKGRSLAARRAGYIEAFGKAVDRIGELYRELHVPVNMDLVCYTPEEFEAMRDSPFIRRALSEGVVLYAEGSDGGGAAVA